LITEIVTGTHIITVTSRVNGVIRAWHEARLCGSVAAARQTTRHAPDERAKQPIQRVMALAMVISTPRCHTGKLGSG
jgi:hypothetical protein